MSIEHFTEEERLLAARAVAAYREARRAMESARHGEGLAVTEAAVLNHGGELLKQMMQQLMSAHSEAQKGGSAADPVRAEKRPRSNTTHPKSS